jgi:hypothetical protein
MNEPVRIQLSRRKGFDLQALSRATNCLDAVVIARPGKWGNPFDFRKSECCWAALSFGCRGDRLGRQEASVRAFRMWIDPPYGRRIIKFEEQSYFEGPRGKRANVGPAVRAGEAPAKDEIISVLRGKNLACWCKPGEPCHADVLLEIANR